MNVLLIKPSGLAFHNFSVTQPLGLMYLASYLRKDDPRRHHIRIADLRLSSSSPDVLADIAREFRPDVVGISALTMEARGLHHAAATVKAMCPDCRVVAGGPHPSVFYEQTLADAHIDCVVLGEGEITFKELVQAFEQRSDFHAVKGIAFRDGQSIRKTAPREFIQNPDTIPFPAWDLIDPDAYYRVCGETPLGRRRYMAMFTSRACPYRCTYCQTLFGKGFRPRSPENVLEEIDLLHRRYGIEWLDIEDDIFNHDPRRVDRICDMIIERGYRIRMAFPNGLRSDRLEKQTLDKLHAAGTRLIAFAVESGSDRIQTLIRKNLQIAKVREAIAHAASLGIFCVGFFMMGFPTETERDMEATVRFAVRSRLHVADFLIVVPFEGTDIFEESRKKLENRLVDFDDYNYMRSRFNLSVVPDAGLTRILRKASRQFYLNPIRLVRIAYRYLWLGNLRDMLTYGFGVFWNMFLKTSRQSRPRREGEPWGRG